MAFAFDGNGQFIDSFDDDDFINNPSWQGDVSKFDIDNFQLRLQAPAEASSAYLSTPSLSINNAQWQFSAKLEFNPSSSNYARIYLVSDQADLSASLNGYFVNIGDTPDEISLYRQSGTTVNKIIDGTDGTVNLSLVEIEVKVTRDATGNWELFIDVGNSGTLTSQGVVMDNTYDASSFFGVFCNYTSTRSDKFYFDDFLVVGDPYVDTIPPSLELVEVLSSNQLLLHFNEEVESTTATNVNNYLVGNNIGLPTTANLQFNNKSVELTFSSDFDNGITQTISVSDLEDLVGNTMTSTSLPFLFFVSIPPNQKDIIITEILADPSPQVGLPEAEYIEILNRSVNPFDLTGWIFSDGNSMAILPFKIVLPGEYLIVTAAASSSQFGITANVIGINNFPTLNNATDTLTLKSPQGETIDSMNYNLTWYRSVDKQEGGWALEIIDPDNTCGEEENWISSENESGGTPGTENSVFANKPDLTGPQIVSVELLADNKLLLRFNEKLNSSFSPNTSFSITPDKDVLDFYFETKALRSIALELSSSLDTRQLYKITVNNIYDCSGNLISDNHNTIEFALPEEADIGDILISEILFNPRPNGVDFVELYNRSNKYIDLINWSIANYNEEKIDNAKIVSSTNQILAPEEYIVLTSDPLILKDHYPHGLEERFFKIPLPTFPDDEGSVAIVSNNSVIIDFFFYKKQFHSRFIKDEEGVSLERISFDAATNEIDNWASASSTSSFATPGYLNSNFRAENAIAVGEVKIDPPIFSPHSLGTNFTLINFHFDQTGFIANVKIYDQYGRPIKTIANNATLGFDGFFRWDGDHEDGNRARAGYYVVWFEVFDANGQVKTFRERVIIALR